MFWDRLFTSYHTFIDVYQLSQMAILLNICLHRHYNKLTLKYTLGFNFKHSISKHDLNIYQQLTICIKYNKTRWHER